MAQTPRRKGKKIPPSGINLPAPKITQGWGCVQGVQGAGVFIGYSWSNKRGRGMMSTQEVTPAGPCPANAIGPKDVCF